MALAAGASLVASLRESPTWEASALVRLQPTATASTLGGSRAAELETDVRVVATTPVARRVVDDLALGLRVEQPVELRGMDAFSTLQLADRRPTREYRVVRTGPEAYRLEAAAAGEAEPIVHDFRADQLVELPGVVFAIAGDDALRARGIDVLDEFTLLSRSEDRAIELVLGGLKATLPDPGASLIRITYRSDDRRLAPRVADAAAAAFLEERAGFLRSSTRGMAEHLRSQLDVVEAQLEAAENELQDFREDEQILALETQASTQVARLAELRSERARLASERDALRDLMDGIRGAAGERRPNYRQLVAFPAFLDNATMHDLVRQLTETERRRTELRARWTERHPGIVAIDEQIAQIENRIGDIGNDYLSGLNEQLATRDAVLARFGTDLERIPGRELQLARLERRVESLADLQSTLSRQLLETEVSEAAGISTARVVEPAALPNAPASPKPARDALLAGLLGLVAGVGLAFLRDRMDHTIRADEDLDQVLGTPVLSRVPRIETESENGASRREALVASRGAGSLPSECYRTLRTNLIYARPSRASREMLIASPGAQDGKSVTASNLAVTFAQQGRKTLLVDADLRRSVQHAIFDVPRRPGLSDFLAGQSILEDVVHPTKVDGLEIVPAGASSPSPSELLSNPLLDYLLQRAREDYDAVIFDSPPVLAVTDATILAGRIDGVVLVVRAGQTHRKAALDALRQLRRVGGQLLGVVMNEADAHGRYGTAYEACAPEESEDGAAERPNVAEASYTPANRVAVQTPRPPERTPAEVVSRAETDRWLDALMLDED